MRDLLNKVGGFEFFNIPIGAAAELLVTMALGGAIMSLGSRFKLPPILSGAGLSALVGSGFGQKTFGAGPADLMSTGLLAEGIDAQFSVIDRGIALVSALPWSGLGESAEMGDSEALGGYESAPMGDLGQATYLTDVERKVQGALRAQA